MDHYDVSEEHEKQMIEHLTYLFLKHGVSMEFYHQVSMRFKDLPRSYKVKNIKQQYIMPHIHKTVEDTFVLGHTYLLQLKRCKKRIEVPAITKTPGPYDGAQFDFMDILTKLAETEVCTTNTLCIVKPSRRDYQPSKSIA